MDQAHPHRSEATNLARFWLRILIFEFASLSSGRTFCPKAISSRAPRLQAGRQEVGSKSESRQKQSARHQIRARIVQGRVLRPRPQSAQASTKARIGTARQKHLGRATRMPRAQEKVEHLRLNTPPHRKGVPLGAHFAKSARPRWAVGPPGHQGNTLHGFRGSRHRMAAHHITACLR